MTSLYLARLKDLHNPIAKEGEGGKKTAMSTVCEWEMQNVMQCDTKEEV